MQNSAGYRKAVQTTTDNFYRLCAFIDKYATPFFSIRHQGHMRWENTLPALLGYFTAMLYNPNNITMQASTSTTLLEWAVTLDLCQMVGYEQDPHPFGHLTNGGTVANLESMWAARELKFLPFGIKDALLNDDHFKSFGSELLIEMVNGKSKPLVEMDSWELFNLKADCVLDLPYKVT